MILTKKATETIDACRFCWMCRHICPIGNATGQERNNARGRAIGLSLVTRNAASPEEVADNVYECALCGACTEDCMTGWDPVAAIKDVRLQLALDGQLPEYISTLIENYASAGNVYGVTKRDDKLATAIDTLPKTADTLLFLGADTRYKLPESGVNAISLLQKAGVEFTVLADEPDSGYALDTLVGAAEDTREAMQKAAAVLSKYKTVIVFDPADAKVFLREYKEWDIPLTAEIVTFTSFVAKLIESGTLAPKKTEKTVTIQDPALLARDLEESSPLRIAVGACANVKEMLLNGKDTVLAGNLLMSEWMPEVMDLTAKRRWANALATGADALVTASPSEYAVLARVKPKSMSLYSLEELLLGE